MQSLEETVIPTLVRDEQSLISMCRQAGVTPRIPVNTDALASLDADLNTLADLEYALCTKSGQYAFDTSEIGQKIRETVIEYQRLYGEKLYMVH